jgi:esterase
LLWTPHLPTLSHSQLTAPGASPSRWVLVLHGLLGRGSNWRALTRALVDAKPGWGGVLVDLRMHGDSQGFLAPHNVEAAALDLDGVARTLPGPVAAVLGHSLGGKVALAYAAQREGLSHAILLDTNPGPRLEGRGSETSRGVLLALRGLTGPWPTREAFVAELEAHGQPAAMARWLAMSLVRREGHFRFGLELEAMEALLLDVLRRDDWALLESPPAGLTVDVILGGRSSTVEGTDRARLESLAAQGRLRLTVLPEAGHWVQVDDPAGTLRAVSMALQ